MIMTKLRTAAFFACVLAVPLAGCNTTSTTGTATTGATSATVTSKVDQAIAEASPKLARYCGVATIAVAAAETFASRPAIKTAIASADITITRFCSAPPTDTDEAIAALADVALQINAALKAAKTEA